MTASTFRMTLETSKCSQKWHYACGGKTREHCQFKAIQSHLLQGFYKSFTHKKLRLDVQKLGHFTQSPALAKFTLVETNRSRGSRILAEEIHPPDLSKSSNESSAARPVVRSTSLQSRRAGDPDSPDLAALRPDSHQHPGEPKAGKGRGEREKPGWRGRWRSKLGARAHAP